MFRTLCLSGFNCPQDDHGQPVVGRSNVPVQSLYNKDAQQTYKKKREIWCNATRSYAKALGIAKGPLKVVHERPNLIWGKQTLAGVHRWRASDLRLAWYSLSLSLSLILPYFGHCIFTLVNLQELVRRYCKLEVSNLEEKLLRGTCISLHAIARWQNFAAVDLRLVYDDQLCTPTSDGIFNGCWNYSVPLRGWDHAKHHCQVTR